LETFQVEEVVVLLKLETQMLKVMEGMV